LAIAIGSFLVIAACGGGGSEPTPTATSEPTPTATSAPEAEEKQKSAAPAEPGFISQPARSGPTDDIETLRELADIYWGLLGTGFVDMALAHLEESYRLEREGTIRKESAEGEHRLFLGGNAVLPMGSGISEKRPPQMTGPGEGDMLIQVTTPTGVRSFHTKFRKVDGEWKITYAEEVK
jgi:hypothetical protein